MKTPIKQMSALCIAQPWATCIFDHGKNVENGNRDLNKRGTIAIYASRSYQSWRFEACEEEYGIRIAREDVLNGFILGFVTMTNVLLPDSRPNPKTKKWHQNEFYGYVLENVVKLKKPVPVKPPNGAVKFWYLKGKPLEDCLRQLTKEQIARFVEWA